ncbi:MAG TPA: DNA polymerase IV [Oryzihumus sp.]|nr:DNA polymerase IV [Oryzihumus sp.]
MRSRPSVMHLDLDAFFSAVEQRDKPSLRGKPVVVGGVGGRGVVATASYEARRYGIRSAMPTAEARRRGPAGTAFLAGRFEAYRLSSGVVMDVLRECSPLVEQVSIDEAYVDLAEIPGFDPTVEAVTELAEGLRARIAELTGGLTASVGVASSKMLAKVASELRKPDGLTVVDAGEELAVLHPLPVRSLGGVGPATAERLRPLGVETVADLARLELADLLSLFGQAHGQSLHRLARAQDDRVLVAEREAKSVSAEETFARDVTDPGALRREIDLLTARVGARLRKANTAGRTVTLKLRRYDFSTLTRSMTLPQATDDGRALAHTAYKLLAEVDVADGVRLLGVGVSGLSDFVQDDLFTTPDEQVAEEPEEAEAPAAPAAQVWRPGQDVVHAAQGAGWVWGSGRSLVTVRFEGPRTGPGPVRTFDASDPELTPGPPPDWR